MLNWLWVAEPALARKMPLPPLYPLNFFRNVRIRIRGLNESAGDDARVSP